MIGVALDNRSHGDMPSLDSDIYQYSSYMHSQKSFVLKMVNNEIEYVRRIGVGRLSPFAHASTYDQCPGPCLHKNTLRLQSFSGVLQTQHESHKGPLHTSGCHVNRHRYR